MILTPTVFVLGAGASWHYGYPTGEKLVDRVIEMAERLRAFCHLALQAGGGWQGSAYVEERSDPPAYGRGWGRVMNDCNLLVQRLQTVRPLVIDHFLEWNQGLRDIGRLLIAAVMLECEAVWLESGVNQNRSQYSALHPSEISELQRQPDSYIRFIVHKLLFGCKTSSDLLRNQVRFITFNYDVSLEMQLSGAFASLDIIEPSDGDKFLNEDRIVHVYGSVRQKETWTVDEARRDRNCVIDLAVSKSLGESLGNNDQRAIVGQRNKLIDQFYAASRDLRTIDPHDKNENEQALQTARRYVSEGIVFYILGYGFEPTNSKRIGLQQIAQADRSDSAKQAMFTNFLDNNVINKRASEVFNLEYGRFIGNSVYGQPFRIEKINGNTKIKRNYYIEKSARTTYDALAIDFHALEGDGLGQDVDAAPP
ncbi:MAG: hypothetical protein ABSE20_22815 [Acetobacteraceae bacterium]|jgi:hypothetical protein